MKRRMRWFVVLAALLTCVWAGRSASAQDTSAQTGTVSEAGEAPDVSFNSPQATMDTFLGSMNRVDAGYEDGWPNALAALDLSLVAEAQGKARARMLLEVLNRLGKIEESDLPGESQVASGAKDGSDPIRNHRFFPTDEHAWVWEQLAGAPDGKIELAVDDQGQWRFTAQTVAGLDRLHASMRKLPLRYRDDPTRLGSELFTLIGPTFERTPPWGWGALLGGIFLGLLAGKIVQAALRSVGGRWDRKGWELRGIVFRNAASPASLALLSAGLFVGLYFIHMENLRNFFNNIVAFLAVVAVGWFLFNLVEVIDAALRHLTAKTESKLDDQIVPLIRKTLRIFLVIVFTLVVAQNIFGLNITGWLAGLGIAGLAVSLAAQDSVKNLFGSITVFFDKPFAMGDFVAFGGHTGKVEEIGFRSTRLRLLSGHLVTIPNMKFIDSDVENISARPYIRRDMNVTITYDTSPDKIDEAVQILNDILSDTQVVEEGKFDMEEQPPRIAFNELNADSLNIRAIYWYQMARDPDRGFFSFMDHCQLVNMKLFKAYGEAGIEFAFPTQTLYLAGDPARQLSVEARISGGLQGGDERSHAGR